MRILVTGGCGFIGSHQVVALQEAGHVVCVIDDLSSSRVEALDRVAEITGERPEFHPLNVLNVTAVADVMSDFLPDAVIHFAGFKSVPESNDRALDYYVNNTGGLLSLIQAMKSADVRTLVFSSSGSVYGETDQLPITEGQAHNPSNPYSMTKSMGERILADLCLSEPAWTVTALRYFNPAGAHPSGLIGEDPVGPPSNLLPALTRSALDPRPSAHVYGDDFNTPDGSGVRDYVHVMDVAETHMRALSRTDQGFLALNVGRGVGVSVYEMIDAVGHAARKEFEIFVHPRRPGDVSALYGDTTASRSVLGPIDWRGLDEICEDAWRWQSKHEARYARTR